MTPFFIIGQARSGTNLTARILSRHPQVSVALDPIMPVFRAIRDSVIRNYGSNELKARIPSGAPFQDYYFSPCGYELLNLMLRADLSETLLPGEIDRLRAACRERASLESPVMGSKMGELTGETFEEVISSMFAILRRESPDCSYIGCKELWIEDFIPLLARAMPHCRFICIERDPRAVVASLLAVAAQDVSQAAHAPSYMRHWRKGIALNRRYQKDTYLAERIFLTRYEDIINSAEKIVEEFCIFLGLESCARMTALSEDGWFGNSGYRDCGRDIYKESEQRWRKALSDEVTAAVDYLCGPEMKLTPYVPVSPAKMFSKIADYIFGANTRPYSWRSDSGDALSDLAWETLRHELLESRDYENPSVLRRCFLFEETFDDILSRCS